MSRSVCLSPNNTLVTINDDLYYTRARDEQVKSISNRKEDKKGYTADKICGALFSTTLGVRSRRCGEYQALNLKKLLDQSTSSHATRS